MTKYFTALLLVICVMSCAQSGVGVYKPPVGNASLPAGVTSCGNALPAEDDQAVTYDADLNCAKWKTVTGEGGALDFNVKEVDNNPSVDTVSSLAFDQADGFAVSNLGSGAVRVDLTLTDAHIPNDVTIDSATSAGTADTALDLECTNCVGDGELASTFSKFSFSTIDTPSGTDPVADSATDTVTLTASGGLSITGNSTNDSIAFGLTLTDAEIPNDITINHATTSDAFSSNPPPCDEGEFIKDMDADGTPTCDTPAGGGGGSVTVQESDTSPSVSDTTTISFNQSQGFTVSDEGSGEAEVGLALDAAQITYADNDDVYPTDNVGAAIEALRGSNGIGPNQTTGKVNWQQVMNMPEAFSDGTDNGAEALGELSDVSETDPQDDDVLVRDSGEWGNRSSAPRADAFAATPDPCEDEGEKAVGIAADGTAICETVDGDDVIFDNNETEFASSVVSNAIKELYEMIVTPVDGGPNDEDSWIPFSVLTGVPEFSVPSGTNPTVDSAGDLAIDITDDQLVYGANAVVLTGQNSKCIVVEQIKAADDNMMIASWPDAVTITSVWCQYNGSAPATPATFTLEDGGGNAMTITGTNPTCTAPGTPPTPAAVTSGNSLTAYELLRFDTTNTPDPATDTYMICVGYIYDRQ